jgi:hypothetical protein
VPAAIAACARSFSGTAASGDLERMQNVEWPSTFRRRRARCRAVLAALKLPRELVPADFQALLGA